MMGGFPNKAADCLSQLYIDQKVRCENEERKNSQFQQALLGEMDMGGSGDKNEAHILCGLLGR